mmetsp:Transcript_13979/g.42012  ORF Transcript_13979/g.42012 Transcript_13979/m.42012 type:complete len:340 (+) Transcript_13979:2-1021(+)
MRSRWMEAAAAAGKPSKARKRVTLGDVAAALGKSVEELEEATQRVEAERAAKEEVHEKPVDSSSDIEDDWADGQGAEAPASAATATATAVGPPPAAANLRVINARLTMTEKQLSGLSDAYYRNVIRLEAARGVRVKEFHAAVLKLQDKIQDKKDIVQVKVATFNADLSCKTMESPKKKMEEVRALLKREDLLEKFILVPPADEQANRYKMIPRQHFKTLMAVLEEKLNLQDGQRLGENYRVRATWPVMDMDKPEFSLEHGGATFVHGVLDRSSATVWIKVLEEFAVHNNKVKGGAYAKEVSSAWKLPMRYQFEVVKGSAEALKKAPDLKEARAIARQQR